MNDSLRLREPNRIWPGKTELGRIAHLLNDGYKRVDSAETNSEFYAMFYRASMFQHAPTVWLFPTSGWSEDHRKAAIFTCQLPHPSPGNADNFQFDVIAFHAPAPSHGDAAANYVELLLSKYQNEPSWRFYIFAADTNVDTEAVDEAKREAAESAQNRPQKVWTGADDIGQPKTKNPRLPWGNSGFLDSLGSS